jgi:hypothetical protein
MERFESKKKLTEWVRSALRVIWEDGKRGGEEKCGWNFGEDASHSHFDQCVSLEALLRCHPESAKKLDGVARIEVVCDTKYDFITLGFRENYGTPMKFGLLLHYGDGRVDDISWTKCVAHSGVGRARKKGAKDWVDRALHGAMRNAVAPQVAAFRHGKEPVCESCGTEVTDAPMHVDHDGEGFSAMARAFLSGLGDADRTRLLSGVVSAPQLMTRHRFHEDVVDLERAWQAYHAEHARLQLVCAHCNLSVLKIARNLFSKP